MTSPGLWMDQSLVQATCRLRQGVRFAVHTWAWHLPTRRHRHRHVRAGLWRAVLWRAVCACGAVGASVAALHERRVVRCGRPNQRRPDQSCVLEFVLAV